MVSRALLNDWPIAAGQMVAPPAADPTAWVLRDPNGAKALFDADYSGTRFWLGGTAYSSKAAFLTAAGGVEVGNTKTFGPYNIPDAPNLIVNPNFATDLAGWTAGGSGTIQRIEAGAVDELELTLAVANQSRVTQTIATAALAMRLRGSARRGTASTGPTIRISTVEALGNPFSSPTISAQVDTPFDFVGLGGASLSLGMIDATSTTGTEILVGNLIGTEVVPIPGWVRSTSGQSGVDVWTFPATPPATDEILLWLGAPGATSTRRVLRWAAADGHVYWEVYTGNAIQAQLDLDAPILGADNKISWGAGNNFGEASLNGFAPISAHPDTTLVLGGAGYLYEGQARDGTLTTRCICKRRSIFNGVFDAAWYQAVALLNPELALVVLGDSGAAGAADTGGGPSPSIQNLLKAMTGRPIIPLANGGTGLVDGQGAGAGFPGSQLDQWLSRPYLHDLNVIHFDMSVNPPDWEGPAVRIAAQRSFFANFRPGQVLEIRSIAPGPSATSDKSQYVLDLEACRDDSIAVLGANYVRDPIPILAALNDGSPGDLQDVSGGTVPRSLRVDTVHINTTGNTAIAQDIADHVPVIWPA